MTPSVFPKALTLTPAYTEPQKEAGSRGMDEKETGLGPPSGLSRDGWMQEPQSCPPAGHLSWCQPGVRGHAGKTTHGQVS